MSDSVFRDPEAVKREMNLPAVISYSFIGDADPAYHARLVALVEEVVGVDRIRRRSVRPSRGGKYSAYKFDVFHDRFEDVEALYARVGKLPGTKFVV